MKAQHRSLGASGVRRHRLAPGAVVFAAAFALVAAAPTARADWFGRSMDRGGDVGAYQSRIANSGGKRHVISGDCMSACTLWLASKSTCVMPDAVLYFHAAAEGVMRGHMVNPWKEVSSFGNSMLLDMYPARVREVVRPWLQSRDYHTLTGLQLAELGVPLCRSA